MQEQWLLLRKYSTLITTTAPLLIKLAGHPLRGWPARLRGHKGSGLWKVWTVPSPPLPSPPLPSPPLPFPPSLPPSFPPSLSPSRVPCRRNGNQPNLP